MRQTKRELEEDHLRQKRQLQAQREEVNAQLGNFRRETERLVAQLMYLTKDDLWERQNFYRKAELSDAKVRQAAMHYMRDLDNYEHELTVAYKKALNDQ